MRDTAIDEGRSEVNVTRQIDRPVRHKRKKKKDGETFEYAERREERQVPSPFLPIQSQLMMTEVALG